MNAARLLNTAAATLAASVLTDSTTEHYRAGFHNRAMFVAPVVSGAALTTAAFAAWRANGNRALCRSIFASSVVTGVLGFAFHLRNVSRRVGGWNSANVFHGAPIAAPLGITTAGLFGLAASWMIGSNVPSNGRKRIPRRARGAGAPLLAGLSAMGLIGTSVEASALHFRGAFQNPFMYAPVVIPPIAGMTLATAALTRSGKAYRAAAALLHITTWLGMAGMGFHAWGVHRRMGGWANWRQNVLAGPPLPAPPAFSALALAGLAALELLETERTA